MTTDPQTARYRHRTTEVEAVQWTGTNADALRAFAGPDFDEIELDDRVDDPDETAAVREADHGTWRGLKPGDWVVKLDGGLYEFSAADFASQYEAVSPVVAQSAPAETALRDRIADVLADADGWQWAPGYDKAQSPTYQHYLRPADAVLAVLPAAAPAVASVGQAAHTTRSAEWRAAAVVVEGMNEGCGQAKPCASCDAREDAAAELRRMADETQPAEARCGCPHPEGEHSVYGCADGCGCEWMPKRPPMDPVHILGIGAPRCDVEFDGGGTCTKAAGHRTPQNQDPHTPPAVGAQRFQPPVDEERTS